MEGTYCPKFFQHVVTSTTPLTLISSNFHYTLPLQSIEHNKHFDINESMFHAFLKFDLKFIHAWRLLGWGIMPKLLSKYFPKCSDFKTTTNSTSSKCQVRCEFKLRYLKNLIFFPMKRIIWTYSFTKKKKQKKRLRVFALFKGCGMGPWLELVSPCFRENVVATYKIWSFLRSLDNLLQKNVIVFFFWKSNFKMALIWKKKTILTNFSHFLVTREKLQKILQHISHSHTYTYFAHPILTFFALPILKKKYEFIRYSFSLVWALCWFLSVPFWNNQ